MGIVEVKGISKVYNQGKSSEVTALRNVDVKIEEGEWVSIMGKSGSGRIKELVKHTAGELGIEDLLKKKTKELSGGQCQREAIARAVVARPKIIFADEPTGALDKENAKNIMGIFSKINKKGTTVVMVTHDKEISKMADREIIISDGTLAV